MLFDKKKKKKKTSWLFISQSTWSNRQKKNPDKKDGTKKSQAITDFLKFSEIISSDSKQLSIIESIFFQVVIICSC